MYRHHPSWVAVRGAGGIGPDRAAGRGRQLVLVLQRRPGEHPQQARRRRRRAVRRRLLLRSTCRGCCSARSRSTVEAWLRRDPASGVDVVTSAILGFESGRRDVHLLDAGRARPARPHLRHATARISIDIPFNIPPDRPTEVCADRRWRSAGRAGDRDRSRFEPADPYTVEAERFAAAILDGLPTPTPPEDAVANLRVIERIFAAGDADGAMTDFGYPASPGGRSLPATSRTEPRGERWTPRYPRRTLPTRSSATRTPRRRRVRRRRRRRRPATGALVRPAGRAAGRDRARRRDRADRRVGCRARGRHGRGIRPTCLRRGARSHPEWSVARRWDEALLDAIRRALPNPPVHARNLFHTSVAMWDAWAAYDPTAAGYIVPREAHGGRRDGRPRRGDQLRGVSRPRRPVRQGRRRGRSRCPSSPT